MEKAGVVKIHLFPDCCITKLPKLQCLQPAHKLVGHNYCFLLTFNHSKLAGSKSPLTQLHDYNRFWERLSTLDCVSTELGGGQSSAQLRAAGPQSIQRSGSFRVVFSGMVAQTYLTPANQLIINYIQLENWGGNFYCQVVNNHVILFIILCVSHHC